MKSGKWRVTHVHSHVIFRKGRAWQEEEEGMVEESRGRRRCKEREVLPS